MVNRRHFSNTCAILTLSALLPADPCSAQNKDHENFIIQSMVERGFRNFVLVDQKSASLTLIRDGVASLRTQVIIGRGSGAKNLTPSGIFSLRNTFNGETIPELVYHINDLALLLHGEIAGREKAMASKNPMDRRLSDGCINIPNEILPDVLQFARDQGRRSGRATPLVIVGDKFNPQDFIEQLQGFKPRNYNPDNTGYMIQRSPS